ncbi:branched-chain amino acid transport system II carrier protein [Pantoea sp. Aalb]|uniref:branched-chain amino acid transport system II carrier protein n=1 Tax=Pantoea sp. Aalb TaxID=2576762 RepID=UPI00351BA8AC
MYRRLPFKDILALGFMTFALFVGAGNIIFPPMVGIQSGEHVWMAAFGFLVSAVGLPVITVIALARVGGGIDALSLPIGKFAGLVLATVCYIAVGPLFAIPRTATVSFEVGTAPLIGNGILQLFIYSFIYFVLVTIISLHPGKLLDTIGHVLAPLKIIALTILGSAVFLFPVESIAPATNHYPQSAFSNGFINGYLTMDTLGALVFGIVIVNAARSRGVRETNLLMRYTILSGVITGIGLTLVYLSLFKLGADSRMIINQNANGAEILHAYVQQTFGSMGSFFLAALIFIACIVTAVGLTCACAEFFAHQLSVSYNIMVFILTLFSMIVSNLGLSHLIKLSIPVLTAIYPPCIVLVILSFTINWWNNSKHIIVPTMIVSLIFGIFDSIKATEFKNVFQYFFSLFNKYIPLSDQGLCWLLPSLSMLLIVIIIDRLKVIKSTINIE